MEKPLIKCCVKYNQHAIQQHIPRPAISHATGIYWLYFLAPNLWDSQLL